MKDLDAPDMSKAVRILYTNYRNETAVRTILPEKVWYGSTSWHPEPQWLLDALDLEKGERRSFAMADIKSWTPPTRHEAEHGPE